MTSCSRDQILLVALAALSSSSPRAHLANRLALPATQPQMEDTKPKTIEFPLSRLFRPQNSTLNLSLWALSWFLSQSWFGFVAWYLFFLGILDGFYYLLGIGLINPHETLAHGYNYSLMLDDQGSATGHGLDYGFNFYNGNYKKDRRQAQVRSYPSPLPPFSLPLLPFFLPRFIFADQLPARCTHTQKG
jgi:hypothetical protein